MISTCTISGHGTGGHAIIVLSNRIPPPSLQIGHELNILWGGSTEPQGERRGIVVDYWYCLLGSVGIATSTGTL